MGLTIFALHEPLLSIYEPGDTAHNFAVREAGARRMAVISTTYFLCGIMDVLTGVLRGMGRSVLPMGTSIFTTCILRIVWIFTVCPLFPNDIGVLYMSYPITWMISIAAHLSCCIVIYKKEKRRFAAKPTSFAPIIE
jgi:Na+-driven multidrug efflux pump